MGRPEYQMPLGRQLSITGDQIELTMLKNVLIKLITLYQLTLSMLIGQQCRFYPTCSQYTKEAIAHHGSVKGIKLGMRRISCCHPWHAGGYDPVPGVEEK